MFGGEYQMKQFPLAFVAFALSLLPFAALAQSISEISELGPEERREYMQSMSKEERQAMREKWHDEMAALPQEERDTIRERMRANRPGGGDRTAMRERWASMSDEERAAFKEQRKAEKAERRQHWESMSEEERAAVRAERKERKAARREHWKSMSDEERAAARHKMGKRKGKRQRPVEPPAAGGITDDN